MGADHDGEPFLLPPACKAGGPVSAYVHVMNLGTEIQLAPSRSHFYPQGPAQSRQPANPSLASERFNSPLSPRSPVSVLPRNLDGKDREFWPDRHWQEVTWWPIRKGHSCCLLPCPHLCLKLTFGDCVTCPSSSRGTPGSPSSRHCLPSNFEASSAQHSRTWECGPMWKQGLCRCRQGKVRSCALGWALI